MDKDKVIETLKNYQLIVEKYHKITKLYGHSDFDPFFYNDNIYDLDFADKDPDGFGERFTIELNWDDKYYDGVERNFPMRFLWMDSEAIAYEIVVERKKKEVLKNQTRAVGKLNKSKSSKEGRDAILGEINSLSDKIDGLRVLLDEIEASDDKTLYAKNFNGGKVEGESFREKILSAIKKADGEPIVVDLGGGDYAYSFIDAAFVSLIDQYTPEELSEFVVLKSEDEAVKEEWWDYMIEEYEASKK